MSRLATLITVLIALSVPVPSAAAAPTVSWVQQSPLPTHESVNGVDMLNETEGWAVGGGLIGQGRLAYEGFVLHTTDGGATWAHQDIPTPEPLHTVKFLDPLHGWALGNDVLWTVDGGVTWNESDAELGGVSEVDFVDLNRGWAASNGGVISRTLDGGRTWTWTPTPTIETLTGIDFVDGDNGWVVGVNGAIYHTTNGGRTWRRQTSVADYLSDVAFVSAQEGWIAGGDTVLHTTDGGASWERQQTPGAWIYAMSFADPLHGWVVGENVMSTSDGGRSWAFQDIVHRNRLWDVNAVSASTAVIVGDAGGIFTTVDAGATWVDRLQGTPEATLGMDANDLMNAWAVGDRGETARTVDGGATWARVPVGDTFGAFDDVDFLPDNTTGWVAGWNLLPQSVVYRSDDGGATWTHQFTGAAYTQFFGVAAISRRVAVAVGLGIWRTTNGGQSWAPVPSVAGTFSDVEFNGRIGFAAGNDATVLRSDDGGATWRDVSPGPLRNSPLLGVSFADSNNGWAVGFFGAIARTTDGGRRWRAIGVPGLGDATFMSVSAIDETTAWVAVDSGGDALVARTTDGGVTWTKELLPGEAIRANAVEFLTAEDGWAGGITGIWRRTA